MISLIPDTTLFIISDHGFGPLESAFYPNTWLEQQGWLRRKPIDLKSLGSEMIRPISSNFDNRYLNGFLRRVRKRVLNSVNSMDRIDLDRSLAYSPEHAGMFGCINLTDKGRRIPGFKDQLCRELKALPGRVPGIDSIDIREPEEIYTGPYVNLAPDILFIVNDYSASVEINMASSPFIQHTSHELRTGGHRENGIFMAYGKHIAPSLANDPSVLDLSPTILAMYGHPIPGDIDGRVLTECMDPDYARALDIRSEEKNAARTRPIEEKGNMEEMRKTLEALGYM